MSIQDLLSPSIPPGQEVPHEYGPSRVGHGEAQCIWCAGTNRENAVISPNHCDTRASYLHTTSRSITTDGITAELKGGGSWLGTAREYIQWHAKNGDCVIWGSETPVILSMRQIEEMALKIAVAAVKAERTRRK